MPEMPTTSTAKSSSLALPNSPSTAPSAAHFQATAWPEAADTVSRSTPYAQLPPSHTLLTESPSSHTLSAEPPSSHTLSAAPTSSYTLSAEPLTSTTISATSPANRGLSTSGGLGDTPSGHKLPHTTLGDVSRDRYLRVKPLADDTSLGADLDAFQADARAYEFLHKHRASDENWNSEHHATLKNRLAANQAKIKARIQSEGKTVEKVLDTLFNSMGVHEIMDSVQSAQLRLSKEEKVFKGVMDMLARIKSG